MTYRKATAGSGEAQSIGLSELVIVTIGTADGLFCACRRPAAWRSHALSIGSVLPERFSGSDTKRPNDRSEDGDDPHHQDKGLGGGQNPGEGPASGGGEQQRGRIEIERQRRKCSQPPANQERDEDASKSAGNQLLPGCPQRCPDPDFTATLHQRERHSRVDPNGRKQEDSQRDQGRRRAEDVVHKRQVPVDVVQRLDVTHGRGRVHRRRYVTQPYREIRWHSGTHVDRQIDGADLLPSLGLIGARDAKYLDLRQPAPRTIYLNAFQEETLFTNTKAFCRRFADGNRLEESWDLALAAIE